MSLLSSITWIAGTAFCPRIRRCMVRAGWITSLLFLTPILVPAEFLHAQEQPQREIVLAAGFDDVWKHTIILYFMKQAPISNADKDLGLLEMANHWMRVETEDWLDCGSAGQGSIADRRVRFDTLIRDTDDGGTSIRIDAQFRAQKVGSDDWIQCNSTGKMEQVIAAEISSMIESGLLTGNAN